MTYARSSAACALLLAFACSARAASYGLDTTFHGAQLAPERCFSSAMATTGDATLYTSLTGANIARLRKDGTLDPSFGNGGVVSLPTSTDYDISQCAAKPAGVACACSSHAGRGGGISG